jgi:hypothetical protein
MFKSQSRTVSSFMSVNTMQELFDLIEADDFYPFTSDSSIDLHNESAQREIKRIYTELRTVEEISYDQNILFYPVDITRTEDIGMKISDDSTGTNTSEDSGSSPESITPQSLDYDDTEFFDSTEWMVRDNSSYKIRPPKLYEFLRLLLDNSRYISYASWVNDREGLFKIHKPIQVAYLWKQVKVRKTNGCMDYDTFARGIRYYYKSGTMIKTHTKHTYCFAR